MKKQAIVIGAMLAAAVAVAAVIVGTPPDDRAPGEPATSGFGDSASLEARVNALESAVSAEREARQLLEDELLILYEVIEALESETGREPGLPVAESLVPPNTPGELREVRSGSRRDDTGRRRAALTEAGFSPDRADWILQRESELRMEAMQARFDQMRSGEPGTSRDRPWSPEQLLREEIGDAEYEMYLDASNRPTSVNIGQVLASSPASTAGLLPGDRITHYDGERVFSTFDLTRQALEGQAGENVVVNIVRDGVPMQVVMPRGPLGISTRRGR